MLNRLHTLGLTVMAAWLAGSAAAQEAPEALPAPQPRSSLDYGWDAYLRGEMDRRHSVVVQWELNDMMRHWSAWHPGGVSFWYSPSRMSYGWSWSYPYRGSFSVRHPGMRMEVRRGERPAAKRRETKKPDVLPPPGGGREF